MQPAGRTFGPYSVVREIGRGGMGVVYEVRHPEIPRRLALKHIITDAADEEALARFGREAELLARVRHRGVIGVNQLGRSPQGPYLVMDYVEGDTLQAWCKGGPLDPRESARIVREVADAVEAVHAQGILHRDLKPENVLLTPEGQPVLLDFGIARALDVDRLTKTGALVGSPAYMAPEQADGLSPTQLEASTDVYGLGATLFHLLSGRMPHDGTSMASLLKQVLVEEPRWPSADLPDLPAPLESVLRKAMAKDRAERYPSAAALRDDLDRFLRGEAVEAHAARGKGVGVMVGAAIGMLLLVAAGVAFAMNHEAPASPEPQPADAIEPVPQPADPNESEDAPKKPEILELKHSTGNPEMLRACFPDPDDPHAVVTWGSAWDGSSGEVLRWDLSGPSPQRTQAWPVPGSVDVLKVAPSGDLVVAVSIQAQPSSLKILAKDGSVRDLPGPKLPGRVSALALCPDLSRIAVGYAARRNLAQRAEGDSSAGVGQWLHLISAGDDPVVLEGPEFTVRQLIWVASRGMLVACSGRSAEGLSHDLTDAPMLGGIHGWRLDDQKLAIDLELQFQINGLAVATPEEPLRWVAGTTNWSLWLFEEGQDGNAELISPDSKPRQFGNMPGKRVAHSAAVRRVTYDARSGRIYSISGEPKNHPGVERSGELRVWTWEKQLTAVTDWPYSLASVDVLGDRLLLGTIQLGNRPPCVEVWPLSLLPDEGAVRMRSSYPRPRPGE